MGNFHKNSQFGGQRGAQGERGGFDRSNQHISRHGAESSRFRADTGKELFQATCTQCGKVCEVPFRPNGKKPVYCNECFARTNGDAASMPSYGRFQPRTGGYGKPEFDQHRGQSSVAHAHYSAAPSNQDNAESKRQFEVLNSKLDRLIRVVESLAHPAAANTPAYPAKFEKPIVDTAALSKAVADSIKAAPETILSGTGSAAGGKGTKKIVPKRTTKKIS